MVDRQVKKKVLKTNFTQLNLIQLHCETLRKTE